MARPRRIAGFAIWGAHDMVVAGEEPVRRASPADLLIAHLPFTTRSRFNRKVENIRRIFAVHDSRFGTDSAWHWRRWLELAEQGRLDEEFERTVFDEGTLQELRLAGVIQSAAEVFAANGCTGQDRIPAYSSKRPQTSAAVAKNGMIGDFSTPASAEIFIKWCTDKAQSVDHRKDVEAYGYAGLYECLFRRYRSEVTAVLEIGIGSLVPTAESSMVGYALPGYRPGGSLRAWREYFENATIFGLDVQRDTQFDEDRIVTRLCDSTDERKVREVMQEEAFPEFFDIIIDDGSHAALDQIATLRNFFQYLKANGVYVIEDIEGNGFLNAIEQVKEICADSPFFFLGPANTAFVLIKRG